MVLITATNFPLKRHNGLYANLYTSAGQDAGSTESNAIKQTINASDLYNKGLEMQYKRC
jgi:hypothetical protein